MTVPELLLEKGYRHYPNHWHHSGNKDLYQKCVRGEEGQKKYYLNIWEWDWTPYPAWTGDPQTYSSEVQLEEAPDEHVDISHHRKIRTLDDLWYVEHFYALTYDLLECLPYE